MDRPNTSSKNLYFCLKTQKCFISCNDVALWIWELAGVYCLHSRIIFLYSSNLSFSSSRRFLYRTQLYWYFLFFLLQKNFSIAYDHLFAFCFYFLRKDFHSFHESFFKVFLCILDNIQLTFLDMEKKIIKKYFIVF